MNGYDLLKAFRDDRSEEAFAELVRRYAGLVYSVAKRRLANANLAEDITQVVFIRFAKTPPEVQSEAELAAWLHRTTVNVTIDTWRSETRRRDREKQTVMEPTTPENTLWEELSPNLDEALDQLHDDDRQALVLRFFGRKKMRDVGASLGVSEDAAKMRVSRALDRMRTKLGVGGAAFTAAILESILDERSVQAAPVQLVSRLASMKLPAAPGVFDKFLRTSTFNLATGAAVLVVVVVSIVQLAQPSNGPTTENAASNSQTNLIGKAAGPARPTRIASSGFRKPMVPAAKPVKTFFHVVEAESGAEMTNARIQAGYFGVGGTEEWHDLLTDNTGIAAIPEPDDVTKTQGMNVFVVAEGHVPKAVRFEGGAIPTDYTIKLDTAMTASGVVVEHGMLVSGVRITIQGPGSKPGHAENVDFQACPVTNRDDGSWSCSYIPNDFTNEITFILKKRGYAVTLPVVPVRKVDLTRLVLVINRGFTITGKITDPQNNPIVNARIKTRGGDSNRRQSASTDEHGVFSLEGVVEDYRSWVSPPLETNENGAAVIRGLAGIGPSHVDLAVQAEDFAPQTNTMDLHDVTNVANFTLLPGNIFRGRVTDEDGNPISNALVQTDWNDQGERAFEWQTRTDADGRFEWDFAPEQPTLFWFESDGYEWQRDVLLAADGKDHEVSLKRNRAK